MYFVNNINDNFLDGQEAMHCLKVLRKQVGDLINITDGKGHFYKAELTNTAKKKASYKILEIENVPETKPKLHLYFSPAKQGVRNEWLLEKCTELGIEAFTPIICEKSERRKLNLDRLNKIIISAIKQSKRAWLPTLNNMLTFAKAIDTLSEVEKYMASYYCEQKNLENVLTKDKDVAIFIGPEGDFTEREINLAQKNNFTIVNLGNYRLRTETACVAVTDLFNILNRT